MELKTSPTQSYLIIFEEDNQETEFQAIDDSQAIGLSQKQYPDHKWKLYRIAGGERVSICDQAPECPQPVDQK